MIKFTDGQKLSTSSIGDTNCIFTATVVKRTVKTITISDGDGTRRCKIHESDGVEFVYPFGQYSMCPSFDADKQVLNNNM